MKAHTSEATALIYENGKIISGGKDNKIVIYKAHAGEYTLEKTIDLEGGYPKSIDYFNGKILVGQRNGNIYEVNESTEEKKLVMASHHEGEAWGLELVPENNSILSVGDDNKILEFDYVKKAYLRQGKIAENPSVNKEKIKKATASTLSCYPPNQQGRAIAYCKKNDHIAVSNNFGKVTIRSRDNLDKKIKSLKEAEEWCEVIRYSPC